MARRVKAGKFKYTLETVLKVRGIKEKKEQEKFAEKKREYLTEKEQEELLKTKKRKEEDDIRAVFKKKEPISDFEKVLRRHSHLGVLKKDIEKQVEKVIQASKVLEDQREKLVSAMKDKKIIEKDKEKTLEKYHKLMQDLELKFLDEIATQRYTREHKKEE